MKKYPRESYYLATKFLLSANPDYKAVFEEQLVRLQTDHIDFYLLHAIFDENCQSYLDSGCIEDFLEQKKAGRIRYLGFSSHAGVEALTRIADHHQWDFAQLQLNYFDWQYGTTQEEYKVLEERNIPIMVMEPVRGGKLASLPEQHAAKLKALRPEEGIPAWAFRFLQSFEDVAVTLSGMSNFEQMEDNIHTYEEEKPLNKEEMDTLLGIADEMLGKKTLPCTACRYCVTHCPQELDIPALLALYNEHCFTDGGFIAPMALSSYEKEKLPSACVGCRSCEAVCPQQIKISEAMSDFTSKLNM